MTEHEKQLPAVSTPRETAAIPAEFHALIENQKQELVIRAQELELAKQRDLHAFTYAHKALEIQVTNQRDGRSYLLAMRRTTMWIIIVVVAVVGGLIFFALWRDKEAFALEVVKAVVFIVTGGAGGYGLAKSQKTNNQSQPPAPPRRGSGG